MNRSKARSTDKIRLADQKLDQQINPVWTDPLEQ